LAFHLVEILTFFLVTQIFSFLATPVSSGFYPLVSVSQAIDFKELLKLIDPHTYFLRREESDWDRAFHLYSSLIFCRSLFS
jgi:hypothetical protein